MFMTHDSVTHVHCIVVDAIINISEWHNAIFEKTEI